MSKVRVTYDPMSDDAGDIPQVYRDMIGGMINSCKKYDKDADFYLFNRDDALNRYGEEQFKEMIQVYDTVRAETAIE